MTFKQSQKYLNGKVFLIGLTFVDKEGKLIEQYQTHGMVTELTNEGLIKIERNDKSIFQIPYNKDTIKEAAKGEYRLRATNEVIKDPAFIMTWLITTAESDNLEDTKIYGFIPTKD